MKYSNVNKHENYNLLMYIRLSYSDSLGDSPVNATEDRPPYEHTSKKKPILWMWYSTYV